MEIQAPKKEKKFLKSIGRIAGVLAQELVLGLGRKYIGKMINKIKIPKKRETLSFLLLLSCTFAFAQYPATGNKQRLGYQTTGDGLVFRGRSNDTTALKPSTLNNAYHIFDTVNNVLFSYIKTKGGWQFNNSDTVIIQGATMPFDSITFNTAKDGTVGVGEVEYNDSQGSLIQGLKGGNVTNVIGQQLHQRVSNVTGSTLSKGTAVYLSGSQGNRITVAKALATSDPTSANTFGIVAESIADNASGYVITEGLITGINTSGLTEDSAVYLSPTVAGGLTSTKPQAPNHGVYIGVCVKSNAGSGELFVKIKNGLELDELHDVLITSPSANASLYYSGGLWRDTTAALLVIDTASMLTNYLRSGVAASTYLTQSNAASTYLPLTGGTLTGNLAVNGTSTLTGNVAINTTTAYKPLEVHSNANDFVSVGVRQYLYYGNFTGIHFGYVEPNTDYRKSAIVFQRTDYTGGFDASGAVHILNTSQGNGGRSADLRDAKLTISKTGNVGILDTLPSSTLSVNGTLGVVGATTLTGALTVNNATVLNEGSGDFDTRIESDGNANMVFVDASTDRVGIGTSSPSKTLDVNGELKISTTTATPTSLLGKDGSNVVGEVTTVTQTGLMKAGGTTANTSSVGIITVAHGLSYTPSQVIATVAQQNSYVIVCHAKDATNMSFTVYDSVTGNALNNISVGFFWLAIK